MFLVAVSQKGTTYISQDCFATGLKCGGIFNDYFILPSHHSPPDSVGEDVMFLGCPVVPFVSSSGQILLPQ